MVDRIFAKRVVHWAILFPSNSFPIRSEYIIRTYSQKATPEFDLVVIGGGSGGISTAVEATRRGAKVAILDYVTPSPRGSSWGLGGTCVNVGCVPKKLMHHAALVGECIPDSKSYGWQLPDKPTAKHNWNKLVENIQNHIQSVNWLTRVELREMKIQYINGFGVFENPFTVYTKTSKGERRLTAKYFLIAVGCRPKYPDIPGALKYGITSDDIFSLSQPPGKTLVVGAGYVGLECAGFLNGLGYDITVMVRSEILRGFDQQMANVVLKDMTERRVKFLHKCVPKSVQQNSAKKLLCKWTNEKNEESSDIFDTIIFAIGRHALTKEIQVDKAGVETKPEYNKIPTVNEQTNVSHIYAVGDVQHQRPQLTPVAIHTGRLLARRLFSNSKVTMDYDKVPSTVFTPLEYGFVGLGEEAAQKKFGEDNIEVYHTFHKPYELYILQRPIRLCYLKVVTKRAPPQEILGMHLVGPHAGEVIQGFASAMKCQITMDALVNIIGTYPTLAQEFTKLSVTKRSGKNPTPAFGSI